MVSEEENKRKKRRQEYGSKILPLIKVFCSSGVSRKQSRSNTTEIRGKRVQSANCQEPRNSEKIVCLDLNPTVSIRLSISQHISTAIIFSLAGDTPVVLSYCTSCTNFTPLVSVSGAPLSPSAWVQRSVHLPSCHSLQGSFWNLWPYFNRWQPWLSSHPEPVIVLL